MATTRRPKRAVPRLPGGLNAGALNDNISYLTRLARAVVERTTPRHLGEFALMGGQGTALALIAANEGVSQNDLARAILMKKSQVTLLIQDLVVRGLVDRSASSTDRRYNALSLTPEGAALWKQVSEGMDQHNEAVMGSLSSAERKELLRLLQKLVAAHLEGGDGAPGGAEPL